MVKKEKFVGFLIFLVILGITLRSFYFYSISLAPFPLISIFLSVVVFLLTYNERSSIPMSLIKFISIILLFISFSIFISLLDSSGELYLNSVLGIVLNLAMFFLILQGEDVYLRNVNKIKLVLYVHLLFFIIQLLSFHLFGEKIDYLVNITGEAQRVNGFSSLESGGLKMFRPSGLFNEPANYSVYMMTILWLLYLAKGLNPIIEKLTVITVMLSFSLSGIFSALCYLFLTRKRGINLKLILMSSFVAIVFLYTFNDLITVYFETRLLNLGSDNSTSVRVSAFTQIFDQVTYMQLFGTGFGNNLITIHLPTIPSLLVYFGVIGAFLFMLIFVIYGIKRGVSMKIYIFFMIISFQFYPVTNTYFCFFWAFIFILSDNGTSKCKNKLTS